MTEVMKYYIIESSNIKVLEKVGTKNIVLAQPSQNISSIMLSDYLHVDRREHTEAVRH